MNPTTLHLNGATVEVRSPGDTPLLYVLSDEIGLKGARFGCGLAQCGSCSVLMDGVEMRSCVTPLAATTGKQVVSLEGLAAYHAKTRRRVAVPELHPLQTAMIELQSPQCGYCYNGMVVKGAELLAHNPSPSEKDVRNALAGHLCRCGTYKEVTEAVIHAAGLIRRGA